MSDSVHDLFQTVASQWLATGTGPNAALEAAAPEFGQLMAAKLEDFSFDYFFHSWHVPGWGWRCIEFRDVFDGRFFFYLPAAWSQILQSGTRALIRDVTSRKQSVQLLQKAVWQQQLDDLLSHRRALAFAYFPLHRPQFHQWLLITRGGSLEPVGVHAVFSAGDWLVVAEGEGSSAASLHVQLTSLINSNPWQGWIHAARTQQPRSQAE